MSLERAIRLPQLGLTMTEGTLVEWLVKPGQAVAVGDLLYVCETEKIANEIAADESGTIGELLIAQGETVPVGAVLATWAGGAARPPSTPAGARETPLTEKIATPPMTSPPLKPAAAGPVRALATPHARKIARLHGVDLSQVSGSGPKGRIKAGDVLAAAAAGGRTPSGPRTVPLSSAQRTVATRMTQSKREVPHFYLEASADLRRLFELHQELRTREAYAGLTLTHWIVQALGMSLATRAEFRRVWADGELLELPDSDVAVAAATDKGLYIAVANNVAGKSLAANSRTLQTLIERARGGRLGGEESRGGATCISNLGGSRVRHVFPIILPGQSSILGVGRTEAVFRPGADGAPLLKQELGLVLSCDHRVLNGMDGARLMDAVIGHLENPLSLLLHNP